MEWARAGRPLPTENTSGDRGIAVDIAGRGALFGVVDGLGHGPDAAAAALCAVDTLDGARSEPLEVLVKLCHHALTGTRGVAMSLVRVDFATSTLTWAGVGNVTANLVAKDVTGTRIRASASPEAGIVGYRIPEIRKAQRVPIRAGDLIVIATDGISEDHLQHIDFAASAIGIADELLSRHAKQSDDAMVLTARHRGPTT